MKHLFFALITKLFTTSSVFSNPQEKTFKIIIQDEHVSIEEVDGNTIQKLPDAYFVYQPDTEGVSQEVHRIIEAKMAEFRGNGNSKEPLFLIHDKTSAEELQGLQPRFNLVTFIRNDLIPTTRKFLHDLFPKAKIDQQYKDIKILQKPTIEDVIVTNTRVFSIELLVTVLGYSAAAAASGEELKLALTMAGILVYQQKQ
jgi:hypothetical protein